MANKARFTWTKVDFIIWSYLKKKIKMKEERNKLKVMFNNWI